MANKKSGRTKGALTDKPNFTSKEAELLANESKADDRTSRVVAWPLDDEPIFLVYGRKTPHRYWTATVEYDRRLPRKLTDAAVRLATQANKEADQYRMTSPQDYSLPGQYWRHATLQERWDSVLLAYQLWDRERRYKAGLIRPPITKDQDRIRRRQAERDRIDRAVRGEIPIQEGSRLERIVAAHRLFASTGRLVDIRADVERREMPHEDEEET